MNLFLCMVIAFLVMVPNALVASGDAETGRAKSQACAGCHGIDGNSNSGGFPSLAGQVSGYISGQLEAYKSGKRKNAIMLGMAQALSSSDMADIDAWYASQKVKRRLVTDENLIIAKQGESLYRGGAVELSIPACMACHGPAGRGIPSNYPRVAGQWSEYLEAQLLAFKSGDRVNKVMNPISHRLSSAQIKALSMYMSALK